MPLARQVSFTLPEQSERSQLDRMRALSAALLGQGGLQQPEAQTVPGYPGPWVVQPAWTEYAAKLANTAATVYRENKAEQKQKDTIAAEQAKMAEALRAYRETGDPNALMGATQTQPAALDLIIQDARMRRTAEALRGGQQPGQPGAEQPRPGQTPMSQPGGPAGGIPMAAWLNIDPSGQLYAKALAAENLEVHKAGIGANYAPPVQIPTPSGPITAFPPEFGDVRAAMQAQSQRQPPQAAPPQPLPGQPPQAPAPLPPGAAPRAGPLNPAQPAPAGPTPVTVPQPVAPTPPSAAPAVRPVQGLGPPGQQPRRWAGQITTPTPAGPVPAMTGQPMPPAGAPPAQPQPLPVGGAPRPVPPIPAAAAPLSPGAPPMGAPQAPFAQPPGMPSSLPPAGAPPGGPLSPSGMPAGPAPLGMPMPMRQMPMPGMPARFPVAGAQPSPLPPSIAPSGMPAGPVPQGMPAPARSPVTSSPPMPPGPMMPPTSGPLQPSGAPGQPMPMPGGAPQRQPIPMQPQPQRIPMAGQQPRVAQGQITMPTPGGPVPAQTGAPPLPVQMPGMIPQGPAVPPAPPQAPATRPDIAPLPSAPRGAPMPVQRQPTGRTGQPIRPQPIARMNPRMGQYSEAIQQAAKAHGVDPNILTWMAQKESAGDAKAMGHRDSLVTGHPSSGLMQLQPATAKRFGVNDPLDPKQAIPGAAKYMSVLLKRYGGDYDKALAAYNWGEGNLDGALARAAKSGKDWKAHIPASTRDYVKYIRQNAVGGGNVGPRSDAAGPGMLERAMDFLIPSAHAQDNRFEGIEGLGRSPTPGQATQVERSKAGGKALDEAFAKSYTEDLNRIGDVPRQLANMRQVVANLSDPSKNLTGPVLGMMPDALLKFTNPDAVNTRQLLEEVVQRGLRPILGAQFTENEGERLIKRMYDPGLPEKDNLTRVQRLAAQMEIAYANKVDAMRYFEQHGTLMGWQGTLPTIADFEAIGGTTGGGGAGKQSDIFQQADEILNRGKR